MNCALTLFLRTNRSIRAHCRIRWAYRGDTQQEIADDYGISVTTISVICSNAKGDNIGSDFEYVEDDEDLIQYKGKVNFQSCTLHIGF